MSRLGCRARRDVRMVGLARPSSTGWQDRRTQRDPPSVAYMSETTIQMPTAEQPRRGRRPARRDGVAGCWSATPGTACPPSCWPCRRSRWRSPACPLGVSLVVLVVGLARAGRHRVRRAGVRPPRTAAGAGRAAAAPRRCRCTSRRGAGDGWFRRMLTTLRDPQSWFDILWCLLGFVTAVVAASVALAWWVAALGGLTSLVLAALHPARARTSTTLAELVGLGAGRGPEIWLNTGHRSVRAGHPAVPVLRGSRRCCTPTSAHVLLSSRAELQQEMTRVEGGRAAARVAEADAAAAPGARHPRRAAAAAGAARHGPRAGPQAARPRTRSVARGTLDDALRQARETRRRAARALPGDRPAVARRPRPRSRRSERSPRAPWCRCDSSRRGRRRPAAAARADRRVLRGLRGAHQRRQAHRRGPGRR